MTHIQSATFPALSLSDLLQSRGRNLSLQNDERDQGSTNRSKWITLYPLGRFSTVGIFEYTRAFHSRKQAYKCVWTNWAATLTSSSSSDVPRFYKSHRSFFFSLSLLPFFFTLSFYERCFGEIPWRGIGRIWNFRFEIEISEPKMEEETWPTNSELGFREKEREKEINYRVILRSMGKSNARY